MTLIHKAWIVFSLGAADLLGWMVTGSGWMDWLLGNNIVTKYGAWTLIAIGMFMWRMGMLARVANENMSLLPDEQVIHEDAAMLGIVTVTNQRLLFYAGPEIERWRFVKGCPHTNTDSWSLQDIAGVELLQNTDVFSGSVARAVSGGVAAVLPRSWTLWGVGLRLRNGTKISIPCGSPLSVARHTDEQCRVLKATG